MLESIALLGAPQQVAEEYGFDYDKIKDLPNFKAQLTRIEAELHSDGTMTKAMAEIGLNKAVETISIRIASDNISNEDLNKFANTLHKISDRDNKKETGSGKPQFTIEINLGSNTLTLSSKARPKTAQDIIDGEVEKIIEHDPLPEVPELEVDDDIPGDIFDTVRSSSFGIDIE